MPVGLEPLCPLQNHYLKSSISADKCVSPIFEHSPPPTEPIPPLTLNPSTLSPLHKERAEIKVNVQAHTIGTSQKKYIKESPKAGRVDLPSFAAPEVLNSTESLATPAVAWRALTLLDYDDTLLPTSWLKKHGYIKSVDNTTKAGLRAPAPGSVHANSLARLETEVEALLKSANTSSDAVVVVTAASAGWVQQSARMFMPRVFQALAKIKIVAARPEHSQDDALQSYQINPARWKAEAFYDQIEATRNTAESSSTRIRILSIGDSSWERTAAHAGAKEGDIVKTVKLCSHPDAVFLSSELRALRSRWSSISKYAKTRDIDVSEWARRKR